MKPTKITVGISTTFNMGQFESIRPNVEISAELDPGETLEEAHAKLYDKLRPLFAKTTIFEAKATVERRVEFGVGDPQLVLEWAKTQLRKILHG